MAGGLVVESLVAAAGVVVLQGSGLTAPALVWAWTTALVALLYLVGDLVLTRRARQPYGDHTSLWAIAPAATAALLVAAVATKTASVVLVT